MKKRYMSLLLIVSVLILQTSLQVMPARAASDWSKEELLAAFMSLCDAYPSHASYEAVGKTIENRTILAFKIGNPKGGVVMWDAALHGGESAGGEVAYLIAKWVLENSTFDPNARRILERNYLIFIPVISADTYDRQNMRRIYDFGNGTVVNIPYGVNLNRNFVYNWGKSGTSNKYDRSEYRGLYPGSEPETQAIRNALQMYSPDFYVNTHQGGGPWLGNWWDSDRATANWITNRIANISSETNVIPYRVQGVGLAGMAVADAFSFGINAWLLELDDGRDWDQDTVQRSFFPKSLPIVRAMCEYSEVLTVNIRLEHDGRAFNISIDSNSNVSNFTYNSTSREVGFDMSGQLGRAGYCSVTFATQLLVAPHTVLLDGSAVIPVENSNSTHTSIYFAYQQSTQHIRIMETTAVPEFPTITAFLAVLSILALFFMFIKRNPISLNDSAKNPQHMRC